MRKLLRKLDRTERNVNGKRVAQCLAQCQSFGLGFVVQCNDAIRSIVPNNATSNISNFGQLNVFAHVDTRRLHTLLHAMEICGFRAKFFMICFDVKHMRGPDKLPLVGFWCTSNL